MTENITNNIAIDYHSELMTNYFSESIIDTAKELKVLSYKDNKAMIFFIDKDKTLNVLIAIDGVESGWERYILSTENYKVCAFDIHHNITESNLKIIYSAQNENNITELRIADISKLETDDIKQTFEEKICWRKKNIGEKHTSGIINYISMSNDGVLFSSSHLEQDAIYSYFNFNEELNNYTLPYHADKIKQLEVGHYYDEQGVFILVENKMLFKGFPDPDYGDASSLYKFDTEGEINAFSLIDNNEKYDFHNDLYVAGSNICKFSSHDDKEIIQEYKSDTKYDKIQVSKVDDKETIWALGELDNQQGLFYLTNEFDENKGAKNKWTDPLIMQEYVHQFDSIKGSELSNQLFFLGKNQSLNYFWQDKETGNWQEELLKVKASNSLVEKETFTININFKSDNITENVQGKSVQISAKANMFIYIDERKYHIGPKKSVAVTIEFDTINIVYPTESIVVPELCLEADFLEQPFVISPASKLYKTLEETITSKEALLQAKRKDGTDLIDKSVNAGVSQNIADATATILAHLNNKYDPKPNTLVVIGNATHESTDTLGSVFSKIGDVLHVIKKCMTMVSSIVFKIIGGAIKVIIKIGKRIIEYVAESHPELYALLESIWKHIKIACIDIVAWIGSQFDWVVILETKEFIKGMFNHSFDLLGDYLEHMKNDVTKMTDKLKILLDSPELTSNHNLGKLSKYMDVKKQSQDNENSSNMLLNPTVSWITNKKSVIEKATFQSTSNETYNYNPLLKIYNKIEKAFSLISQDVSIKVEELINDKITIDEFVIFILKKGGAIVIQMIEEVINAIITCIQDIIKSIQLAANSELYIPIISEIYRKVDPEGTSSTIDMISLILAIPVTSIYELLFGEKLRIEESEKEFTSKPSFTTKASHTMRNSNISYNYKAIDPYRMTASANEKKELTWEEGQSAFWYKFIAAFRCTRCITNYLALCSSDNHFVTLLDKSCRLATVISARMAYSKIVDSNGNEKNSFFDDVFESIKFILYTGSCLSLLGMMVMKKTKTQIDGGDQFGDSKLFEVYQHIDTGIVCFFGGVSVIYAIIKFFEKKEPGLVQSTRLVTAIYQISALVKWAEQADTSSKIIKWVRPSTMLASGLMTFAIANEIEKAQNN